MKNEDKVLKEARRQVGIYIKDIREHKELSQWKLAKLAGVDVRQIQSLEDGSRAYTIDLFLAVTRALDLYFYLAEKGEDKNEGHDLDDLMKRRNDPI